MKYIYLFCAFWVVNQLKAQEFAQYSQYTVNPILINPALAGFNGEHQLLLNYRRQWSGFPGTPSMVTFIYNGALAEQSGVGLGIFNESIGAVNRFRAGGMYAFNFQADDFKMSMGLGADYVQHRLNNSALVDPSLDPNDPIIQAAADGISFFDAAFGIYATYKDRLFVSLSAPHLVRARLNTLEDLPETDPTSFRSFIAQVGTRVKFLEEGLNLEPSVCVRKMYLGPLVSDVNLIASILDDQLYAGVTYRFIRDAGSFAGLLLGAKINRFSVFYQYDAGFGTFQNYNSGSHEIGIMYAIPRRK